jgi:hypothetical protein
MNAEQRLDYLLEVIPVPSGRGRLTHTWVAENIGLAVADQVYAEVKKVSEPTALRFATGDGIDTSAELWKTQAEVVAAQNHELVEHLEMLRDFESDMKPRWQKEGYAEEPTLESVQAELDAENAPTDEVRHEVLLSCNRGTDGVMRVMARVTPVEFVGGAELRRGEARTLVNDAAMIAALNPIIEGLMP